MKFCSKCGTRLKMKQVKSENVVTLALQCERCGSALPVANAVIKSESEELTSQIKVLGDEADVETMPTIDVECPKCGNRKASWWMLQTRGGDEATTQFYRCTKCRHTWREYA